MTSVRFRANSKPPEAQGRGKVGDPGISERARVIVLSRVREDDDHGDYQEIQQHGQSENGSIDGALLFQAILARSDLGTILTLPSRRRKCQWCGWLRILMRKSARTGLKPRPVRSIRSSGPYSSEATEAVIQPASESPSRRRRSNVPLQGEFDGMLCSLHPRKPPPSSGG